MKIRIKGNAIRLRLTRTDVDTFGRDGYVEERTEFANNLFIYALKVNPDVKELSATFVGIKITMQVPAAMAAEWTTTERVGYENTLDTGNGRQLFLLIEKDFKCIDAPVYEDQSDNYEHPDISCAPADEPTIAVAEEIVNAEETNDTAPITETPETGEPGIAATETETITDTATEVETTSTTAENETITDTSVEEQATEEHNEDQPEPPQNTTYYSPLGGEVIL